MKEESSQHRRFSSCTGVSSVLFPPRIDGRKLVRNASFGGYNELSPSLQGLFVCLILHSCLNFLHFLNENKTGILKSYRYVSLKPFCCESLAFSDCLSMAGLPVSFS